MLVFDSFILSIWCVASGPVCCTLFKCHSDNWIITFCMGIPYRIYYYIWKLQKWAVTHPPLYLSLQALYIAEPLATFSFLMSSSMTWPMGQKTSSSCFRWHLTMWSSWYTGGKGCNTCTAWRNEQKGTWRNSKGKLKVLHLGWNKPM